MSKPWIGLSWKLFSWTCFAGINTLVRYLSGGSPVPMDNPLPIYTIMFFQNAVGLLLLSLCLFIRWGEAPTFLDIQNPKLHTLRVMVAGIGIGLWYISLQHIPVPQVVALSSIGPIITVLGAVIFLRESFGRQRKIAVGLAILGGFLITRPDLSLQGNHQFGYAILLPILAAIIFAIDKLLCRRLMQCRESALSVTFLLLSLLCPICLLPASYFGWTWPTLSQLPWLVLLGSLGLLAHFSFSRAYQYADVTFLTPFGIAKIILCSIVSYMVFYEFPNSLHLMIGIVVITLSTLVLSYQPKSRLELTTSST